jgi:hypothetical protein
VVVPRRFSLSREVARAPRLPGSDLPISPSSRENLWSRSFRVPSPGAPSRGSSSGNLSIPDRDFLKTLLGRAGRTFFFGLRRATADEMRTCYGPAIAVPWLLSERWERAKQSAAC